MKKRARLFPLIDQCLSDIGVAGPGMKLDAQVKVRFLAFQLHRRHYLPRLQKFRLKPSVKKTIVLGSGRTEKDHFRLLGLSGPDKLPRRDRHPASTSNIPLPTIITRAARMLFLLTVTMGKLDKPLFLEPT